MFSKKYLIGLVLLAGLALVGTMALAEHEGPHYIHVSNELRGGGSVYEQLVTLEWGEVLSGGSLELRGEGEEAELQFQFDHGLTVEDEVEFTFIASTINGGLNHLGFEIHLNQDAEIVLSDDTGDLEPVFIGDPDDHNTIRYAYYIGPADWEDEEFTVTISFTKGGNYSFNIVAVQFDDVEPGSEE